MWLEKHTRLILLLAGCAVVLFLGVEPCLVISRIRENNRHINELVLQDRLDFFRRSLRQYAESRNELPQSLAELRSSGLAHNLEDPITGKDDWQVEIGEDPKLLKGKKGIINIHSSSTAISSRGTPYNSW
jgi:hypothetical protein